MFDTLLQAVLAFAFTGIAGTWIAQNWQKQSAKDARFFEASKVMYGQMEIAANELAALIGKRIYASQRVCFVDPESPSFNNAVQEYRASIIEWNERLLSLELAVRTRFRDASLWYFETLQSGLANVTNRLDAYIRTPNAALRRELVKELRGVRFEFFDFIQDMMREARLLHRQMHFGVLIRYERGEIEKMSTPDLIKCLFTSRIESKPIVRSPSDFGAPVDVWEARLGIYE
jgi:hypothetical protein